jgi:hypothetical protein
VGKSGGGDGEGKKGLSSTVTRVTDVAGPQRLLTCGFPAKIPGVRGMGVFCGLHESPNTTERWTLKKPNAARKCNSASGLHMDLLFENIF